MTDERTRSFPLVAVSGSSALKYDVAPEPEKIRRKAVNPEPQPQFSFARMRAVLLLGAILICGVCFLASVAGAFEYASVRHEQKQLSESIHALREEQITLRSQMQEIFSFDTMESLYGKQSGVSGRTDTVDVLYCVTP